jgi:hypothetical protein
VDENGAAGLECYLNLKDEIALVLADVLMPWVNGVEMAGHQETVSLSRSHPEDPICAWHCHRGP